MDEDPRGTELDDYVNRLEAKIERWRRERVARTRSNPFTDEMLVDKIASAAARRLYGLNPDPALVEDIKADMLSTRTLTQVEVTSVAAHFIAERNELVAIARIGIRQMR